MEEASVVTPNKHAGKIKLGIAAIAIVAFIVIFRMFNVQERLVDFLAWIDGLGALGPVVFIVAYVLATVLFLPGSILTAGAGFLFNVLWGTVYVSIASVTGATLAFLIGRYLARQQIEKKIEGNEKFKAVDDAVAKEGWKIVLLTRLSPVFPFNLLNYAYGLTQVSLRDYVLASWIGMLPGTVMYVYLGSLAQNLATLGAGGKEKTPEEWALLVVGLVATIAVTIYITKIAKKALNQKID